MANPLLERLALEALHGDEGPTFLLSNFVDRAHAGMIQRRGSAGLAAETFQKLMILGKLLRQELERHAAAELRVFGLINYPHAARTELFQDAVVGNSGAGHRNRRPPGVMWLAL